MQEVLFYHLFHHFQLVFYQEDVAFTSVTLGNRQAGVYPFSLFIGTDKNCSNQYPTCFHPGTIGKLEHQTCPQHLWQGDSLILLRAIPEHKEVPYDHAQDKCELRRKSDSGPGPFSISWSFVVDDRRMIERCYNEFDQQDRGKFK